LLRLKGLEDEIGGTPEDSSNALLSGVELLDAALEGAAALLELEDAATLLEPGDAVSVITREGDTDADLDSPNKLIGGVAAELDAGRWGVR